MSIFQQILDGKIPADIVWEDEHALAFRDIRPVAPVHILVIPRKFLRGIDAMGLEDRALVGHLMWVAREVASAQGLDATGYRLIVNNGADGGQSVDHLHIHVLGGRELGWPPG